MHQKCLEVRTTPSTPPCTELVCKQVRQLPQQQKRKELKKLAVKWHPDRNKEHPELATRLFQLIEF